MKKYIIALSCLMALSFIDQAHAQQLGARAEFRCEWRDITGFHTKLIETTKSYCSEYEAEKDLIRDARSYCYNNHLGRLSHFRLTHFFYYR